MSGPDRPSTQPNGVTGVTIDRWAAGGRGLGRVAGKVWMVAGAVPGDRVEALPIRDHGRHVDAVVRRLLDASQDRRVPPCPLQSRCGGCPMMPVAETAQREAKRRFVVDALERLGGFRDVPVADLVPIDPALGYRTRIELTPARVPGGGTRWGYHRVDDPQAILDVPSCTIAHPALQPLLDFVRSRPPDASGDARLILRVSRSSAEKLVALRGEAGSVPPIASFARAAMAADPDLVGVVRLVSTPGRRGGSRTEVVAGRGWIEEEVLGTTFRVPGGTFLQVHAAAAEALGRRLLEEAGDPDDLVELYAGVGAIGLAAARRGTRATLVDADPDAIACGDEAARRLGLDVALVRSDVLRFLAARAGNAPPALVVADPPRTGFGRGVASRLATWGPPRIAVVSCDPATLARDAAALTAGGYVLERVAPYDFFPQTAHVEALAWLRRR